MNPFTEVQHIQLYLGLMSSVPIKRNLSEEEKKSCKKRNIEIKKTSNWPLVNDLTIVAPSEMVLAEEAYIVYLKISPSSCILMGWMLKHIRQEIKNYSRDLLGIPKDKKKLSYLYSINNRKGFVFKRAFEQLADEDLFCAPLVQNSNLGIA
jgi:hypothetical protein